MTTDLAPEVSAAERALRDGSGCPTALAPVVARDGLLFRITLPAGRIAASFFARIVAFAARSGGAIEITNRANLQLRGIPPALRDQALAILVEESGLDVKRLARRRTILVSPLAGLDPTEGRSPLALSRQIDETLTAIPGAERLSPKFGVALDFGARGLIGAGRMDAVLSPFGPSDIRLSAACFETDLILADADAPRAVAVLADWLLDRGAMRLRDLAGERMPDAICRFARATAPRQPCVEETQPLLGTLEWGARRAIAAAVPFGALDPTAAAQIASFADETAEIRLAPWPGLVLANVRTDAVSRLTAVGLVDNPADLRLRIHACVGIAGCIRADNDARGDARAVAAALAGMMSPPLSVHVSGCARGCAHPARTAILALARGDGAYDVFRNAAPSGAASIPTEASGIRPEDLAATVRRLGSN